MPPMNKGKKNGKKKKKKKHAPFSVFGAGKAIQKRKKKMKDLLDEI